MNAEAEVKEEEEEEADEIKELEHTSMLSHSPITISQEVRFPIPSSSQFINKEDAVITRWFVCSFVCSFVRLFACLFVC